MNNIKFESINIERDRYSSDKTKRGKYKCRMCFTVAEDVTLYANADEVITAQLVEVLMPVFEKVTNEKYEAVKEEADTFLTKMGFRKKEKENNNEKE